MPIKWLLNYNYTAQKNIDKIMSDLFVFRCQKCSIGKLIFYNGGEYKILHRQFFGRNTLQNSFLNKKIFFFINKVEGSEIVGLKIFRSNSQANMIFITYTLLKCLPNKTMQLILYDDGHFTCSVKVRAISFI